MITATTMAAMPMRYSFPEKSSSIFWWQSACGGRPAGGQGCGSSGPHPAAARGHCRKRTEGHSPGCPQRRREQGPVSAGFYLISILKQMWTQGLCRVHSLPLSDHSAPQGWMLTRGVALHPHSLPHREPGRLTFPVGHQQSSAPGRSVPTQAAAPGVAVSLTAPLGSPPATWDPQGVGRSGEQQAANPGRPHPTHRHIH